MQQINRLTPEQSSWLPKFALAWALVALDTRPANRPRAEYAISELYALANLKKPKFVWLECPLSAALCSIMYADLVSGVGSQWLNSIKSRQWVLENAWVIECQIGTAAIHALRSKISAEVYARIVSEVQNSVLAAVSKVSEWAVSEDANPSVFFQIDDAFCNNNIINDLVPYHLTQWVLSETDDSVIEATGYAGALVDAALNNVYVELFSGMNIDEPFDYSKAAIKSCGRIHHQGSLVPLPAATMHFFQTVLSVPVFPHFFEISQSCGHYWMLDEVCFVSERPAHIHIEGEIAVSVSYPNGWTAVRTKSNASHCTFKPNFSLSEDPFESLERDPNLGNF
ncbi:MAG: hypothetical protein JWQ21_3376 [Herminiimonas sp.]|nr:hypothetical protein [Herminiimonas sp.]